MAVLITRDQVERSLDQANQQQEKLLSFRGRINWFISSAKRWLESLENEPEIETFAQKVEAFGAQLKIEQDEAVRRNIAKKCRKAMRKMNTRINLEGDLRALIREGNKALELFEVNDIDRALRHYDRMHEYRARSNLPAREKIPFENWGRIGGPLSRKPPNPLDVIVEEIIAEFLCFKSEDAWKLWQNWDSPSEAWYGSGLYECYYDEGLYHFTFNDQKQEPVTKRDIQQAFSRIRIPRR